MHKNKERLIARIVELVMTSHEVTGVTIDSSELKSALESTISTTECDLVLNNILEENVPQTIEAMAVGLARTVVERIVKNVQLLHKYSVPSIELLGEAITQIMAIYLTLRGIPLGGFKTLHEITMGVTENTWPGFAEKIQTLETDHQKKNAVCIYAEETARELTQQIEEKCRKFLDSCGGKPTSRSDSASNSGDVSLGA